MRRVLTTAAAAAAGVVVLISAGLAPAALADGKGTGSGIDKQRLMRKQDVPAVLGKTTSYGFSNRTLDHSLGICEDGTGKVVSIPAPTRQAEVVITNKGTTAAPYSDESEFVYQYPGTDVATAAFASLKAAAAGCTGVTTGKNPGSGDTGVTLTTTLTTGATGAGAAGTAVWVQESTVYNAPPGNPAAGAKTLVYKVFAQPGDAIVVTQYYVNGASAISADQVAAVQQLSAGNAMRWMARR